MDSVNDLGQSHPKNSDKNALEEVPQHLKSGTQQKYIPKHVTDACQLIPAGNGDQRPTCWIAATGSQQQTPMFMVDSTSHPAVAYMIAQPQPQESAFMDTIKHGKRLNVIGAVMSIFSLILFIIAIVIDYLPDKRYFDFPFFRGPTLMTIFAIVPGILLLVGMILNCLLAFNDVLSAIGLTIVAAVLYQYYYTDFYYSRLKWSLGFCLVILVDLAAIFLTLLMGLACRKYPPGRVIVTTQMQPIMRPDVVAQSAV